MIYRFTSRSTFNTWNNKDLKYFQNDKQKSISFAKVRGIPNPWFTYLVVDGKIDKSKILTPKQMDRILKKFFAKRVRGIYE